MTLPDNTTYTLLIVEDNPDLLDMMLRTLPRAGPFTAFGAPDGVSGLEQFEAVQPHCVVIDVKMPRLNGYQLVRAIRGDPTSAATPIIILTAMAQEQAQFTGLAAGADRYLLKPVSSQELAAQILSVIDLSEDIRQQRLREFAEDESKVPMRGVPDEE
ncbi:MAG: response regulator [Ktedonobacterales bacterium]|nr:response regulator [Ktedonobacterales bacterium]